MWSFTVLQLTLGVVTPPVVAALMAMLSGESLAERHHLHHDTYAVSQVASRSLMLVMVFMAVLGCLSGWLSQLGVFATDPRVPLWFFVSFEVSLLVAVIALSRYRVMAYSDRMVIKPAFGRTHTIFYRNIRHMRRTPSTMAEGMYDLMIEDQDGTVLGISGMLDIERILMRINRFDVLDG
jgi:hypothetical protein